VLTWLVCVVQEHGIHHQICVYQAIWTHINRCENFIKRLHDGYVQSDALSCEFSVVYVLNECICVPYISVVIMFLCLYLLVQQLLTVY